MVRRSARRAFAQLTGVSRERLRTWERRYGFPAPRRVGAGPRRYAVEDVPRVVAVRHAADGRRPARRGRSRARRRAGRRPPGAARFAALVDHAPVPVAALSGPAPLRVEYVNAALRAIAGAPRAGDELDRRRCRPSPAAVRRALLQLFATAAGAAEAEHPRVGRRTRASAARSVARSACPSAPGAAPLVAMVGARGRAASAPRARRWPAPAPSSPACATATRATTAGSTRSRGLAGRFQPSPGRRRVATALDVARPPDPRVDAGAGLLRQRPPRAAALAARRARAGAR